MLKPNDRIRYTIGQNTYTATVLRIVGDPNPIMAQLTKELMGRPLMKRGDLIVMVDGCTQELPLPVGVIPIEVI